MTFGQRGGRAALRGFLLGAPAPDYCIAQKQGQKQDPAWSNQEQEPQQGADDDGHALSYEHLPCHAQCPFARKPRT